MTTTSRAAGVTQVRGPLAIFLFSLTIGLIMAFVGFRTQSLVDRQFDPYFFGEMGTSLARGEGFAAYGTLLHRRAPLYPLWIGGIYRVFGESPLLVELLQSVLLAGTCVLAFDMGRRVFNTRTGLIAGVLCAIQPLLIRYVADLHLETLLTFLFTLTIWLTIRLYGRPTLANGALVGVAGALAALTKAVVVMYPALFGAVLVTTQLRKQPRSWSSLPWAPIAVMLLTTGLVIAPWTARNYRATGGHFVLISSGAGDAFLRGYIFSQPDYALLRKPPYVDAENDCNALFRSLCRRQGTEWERDDYETDQILSRAAKEKLLAEPGEFVRKFGVGLFAFWYEMTSLTNSLVVGGIALAAWALAIVGWRRGHREGRPVWLLLLPVLHLNLLLAALLALGRYSAPVLPALLIVSAYGVDTLLSKLERSSA